MLSIGVFAHHTKQVVDGKDKIMPDIKSFSATIQTANVENAGTDGDVYLGICGREFYLDSSADDFERGSNRTYKFGDGANILNKDLNDPRKPQLRSEDLNKFPVYIRFEPSGESPDWNLTFVNVEIAGTGYGISFPRGLWLGRTAGKTCFLREGRFGE
jgi:hypothetical protein